jgi:hypothetical protein
LLVQRHELLTFALFFCSLLRAHARDAVFHGIDASQPDVALDEVIVQRVGGVCALALGINDFEKILGASGRSEQVGSLRCDAVFQRAALILKPGCRFAPAVGLHDFERRSDCAGAGSGPASLHAGADCGSARGISTFTELEEGGLGEGGRRGTLQHDLAEGHGGGPGPSRTGSLMRLPLLLFPCLPGFGIVLPDVRIHRA